MGNKAANFDRLAREVFAPVYPVVAEQIVRLSGISRGCCLDIGCAGGYLGLALAQITKMEIMLFDQDPAMLDLAQSYIQESGFKTRVKTLRGDVEAMPLGDAQIDLAVSRGSMFFWPDRVKAFREIYRVLAVGGVAMIGGGFGNTNLLKEIEEKMLEISPEWKEKRQERIGKDKVSVYQGELEEAAIPNFEILQDEVGLWIMFRK